MTMRAAIVSGPRSFSLQQINIPALDPRSVRIRVEGSGVCASSLPVWEGREWFHYPLEPGAPGHEGWGVVEAVGDAVTSVREGDRVAYLSSSAFAEFDLAEESSVVPIPAGLRSSLFPGEAVGCAMNIFRRSDIRRGQTVAIIGIGFLGALLTRLAANAGARVIGISRRAYALQLARDFGAAETIPMRDHSAIIRRVKELTDEGGCERVIECVGLQWPLDLATELVAEGGRLIIAGYHQDGPRQVNLQLWNWRGIDVINAHERDPRRYVEGIRAAAEAIASGQLDPSPLYTHTVPLADTARAFDLMAQRPDGFVKALVVTA
jgi:threonine dehydrogenase-like Zn-dependent dehydrogenase